MSADAIILWAVLVGVPVNAALLAGAIWIVRRKLTADFVKRDERQRARLAKLEAKLEKESREARRAEENLALILEFLTARELRAETTPSEDDEEP